MKRFLVQYSVFGKDSKSLDCFLLARDYFHAREKFNKAMDCFSGKYSINKVCEVSKKDYGVCK